MKSDEALVLDSAQRLFCQLVEPAWLHGAHDEWPAGKWKQLTETGLQLGLVREEDGGFGLSSAEALSIVRLTGYHGLPLPLGETMIAARLIAASDQEVPSGPLSFASPSATRGMISELGGTMRTSGTALWVPWARHADQILVALPLADKTVLVSLAREAVIVTPGTTLAGEPCDGIEWDVEIDGSKARLLTGGVGADLELAGAAIRTLAIAGAAERLLDMTTRYALDRQQFGRALTKFQAIQQYLAVLAGQAVICRAAADMVTEALFESSDVATIAMAKARASESAGLIASIAHQVHGAIGFSDEYDLHLFSKRLWSWREEFGSEHHWNELIGSEIVADSAQDIWAWLTKWECA